MGNFVIYPAPRASYEHSEDDSTLLFIEQKIDSAFCGAFGCTEKRKKSTKIPCRYIRSQSPSPYLLMYFHANCEDIGLCLTKFMSQFGERFMMNVICPEYPCYGVYKDKDDSLSMEEAMINDAKKVIKHCNTHLGFKYENIILIGRSLGTGVAVQLASEFNVRGLVLISAFTSIRDSAKYFVGNMLSMVVPDAFRSIDYVGQVKSPMLFIHGKKDGLIPSSMSVELAKKGISAVTIVKISETMTHNQFKLESDVFSPIYEFMVEQLELKTHLTMKSEKVVAKNDDTTAESEVFDVLDREQLTN